MELYVFKLKWQCTIYTHARRVLQRAIQAMSLRTRSMNSKIHQVTFEKDFSETRFEYYPSI